MITPLHQRVNETRDEIIKAGNEIQIAEGSGRDATEAWVHMKDAIDQFELAVRADERDLDVLT